MTLVYYFSFSFLQRDNLRESVFFFHHVGVREGTRATRLGSKHFSVPSLPLSTASVYTTSPLLLWPATMAFFPVILSHLEKSHDGKARTLEPTYNMAPLLTSCAPLGRSVRLVHLWMEREHWMNQWVSFPSCYSGTGGMGCVIHVFVIAVNTIPVLSPGLHTPFS